MDRDAFMHGVFFFPGRRLHFLKAGAHHDIHLVAAQPARGAAAIHRGVAAAQHDHALADAGGMAERNAGQPVDADMDIGARFLAAGNFQLAAARRAAADEDGVIIFRQQRLHASRSSRPAAVPAADRGCNSTSSSSTVSGRRNFGIWVRIMPPAVVVAVIEHAGIAERQQIARHRQRGGAGADQRHALAVFRGRRCRHAVANIVLVVGGDALQAADGDRLAFLVTSSTRPRRQAGSQGRSQVRPRIPGNTLECQLTI